jgi:hypothetical protein
LGADDLLLQWLQPLSPLSALVAGFAPAVIARFKRRPVIRWYLYGFVCALAAWPLVALPAAHALLLKPRAVSPELVRKQRRAQAMALFAESSTPSYPSWIADLRRKSPAEVDRRRYAYEHLGPGEALELVREPANRRDDHAVLYYHRGIRLGSVPKRHRWVADAIDDGHRLVAIVHHVKIRGFLRRRAKFVSTRIAILDNGGK